MRRAARLDDNHREIAEAFERLGCSFVSLAALGAGAPDGAVGYGGLTMLVEIKDGKKSKSRRKLTPAQEKFWDRWRGAIRLVDGMEAVVETVNVLRAWHRKLCALP